MKEKVLLASVNVILGADSEAKQAGAAASALTIKRTRAVPDWG